MKSAIRALGAIIVALPLSALAVEAGHPHGAGEPQKIELNAGKKWTTDAPLRKGMSNMRRSVAAALPLAHSGKMTQEGYAKLGKDLGGQVSYIVGNCKLDPKADAQLHVVIGEIVGAIDVLEGKEAGTSPEQGVVKAVQALNTYGTHFAHPGWQSIKLPE